MTKKINGKNKGNRFERELAKKFESHFGFQFRRTPQSGAYVGGNNRGSFLREDVTEILAGDLIAGDPDFPFCVEAKNYKDEPQFHQLLQNKSIVFDEWIKQATADADDINKIPLIVFKINNKGTFAAFPQIPDITVDMTDADYLQYNNFAIMDLDKFLQRLEID